LILDLRDLRLRHLAPRHHRDTSRDRDPIADTA